MKRKIHLTKIIFFRNQTFNQEFYLSLQLNFQYTCVQVYAIKSSTFKKSV